MTKDLTTDFNIDYLFDDELNIESFYKDYLNETDETKLILFESILLNKKFFDKIKFYMDNIIIINFENVLDKLDSKNKIIYFQLFIDKLDEVFAGIFNQNTYFSKNLNQDIQTLTRYYCSILLINFLNKYNISLNEYLKINNDKYQLFDLFYVYLYVVNEQPEYFKELITKVPNNSLYLINKNSNSLIKDYPKTFFYKYIPQYNKVIYTLDFFQFTDDLFIKKFKKIDSYIKVKLSRLNNKYNLNTTRVKSEFLFIEPTLYCIYRGNIKEQDIDTYKYSIIYSKPNSVEFEESIKKINEFCSFLNGVVYTVNDFLKINDIDYSKFDFFNYFKNNTYLTNDSFNFELRNSLKIFEYTQSKATYELNRKEKTIQETFNSSSIFSGLIDVFIPNNNKGRGKVIGQ